MSSVVRAVAAWLVCVGLAGGLAFVVAPAAPYTALWAALAVGALNLVAFVPAALRQTERFYDLVGAASTLLLVGVLLAAGGGGAGRLLFAAPPLVWALRLGTFLAGRAHREGDGRFDQIKTRPARFAVAWALQSLWVTLTNLSVIAALSVVQPPPLGPVELLGLALWALGFGVEVLADRQKAAFRARPESRGRFIDEGLWARCRHPNYLGEITLWTGLFVTALPRLGGGAWLAVVSPLFVFVLLRFGSGIPLLEARASARWGEDPAFQRYLAEVPRLLPRFGRR